MTMPSDTMETGLLAERNGTQISRSPPETDHRRHRCEMAGSLLSAFLSATPI